MTKPTFLRRAVSLALLVVTAAASADYSFEVYKTPLAGYDNTWALGITDHGHVFGWAFDQKTANNTHFFAQGRRAARLTLNEGFSPSDIAMCGDMVGNLTTSTSTTPVYRNHRGLLTPIVVPGAVAATANGLNNHGAVVGNFSTSSGNLRGFLTNRRKLKLFHYPGAMNTSLSDINDRGWAVGYAAMPDFSSVTFMTDGQKSYALSLGLPAGDMFVPRFVNNQSRVAGTVQHWNGEGYDERPAVYHQGAIEMLQSPKAWPATTTLGTEGNTSTVEFVSERFTVTGLNKYGVVTAISFGTYRDPMFGFEYTFAESYLGRP